MKHKQKKALKSINKRHISNENIISCISLLCIITNLTRKIQIIKYQKINKNRKIKKNRFNQKSIFSLNNQINAKVIKKNETIFPFLISNQKKEKRNLEKVIFLGLNGFGFVFHIFSSFYIKKKITKRNEENILPFFLFFKIIK